MNAGTAGRRVLRAAVACPMIVAVVGCGPAGDEADVKGVADLAYQAQQVGVALDRWHSSQKHDLLTEFRPVVLKRAAVRLAEGVHVDDYATARTGSTTNHRDLWQFCLRAEDGSWVTYGDETTLQDYGDAEDDACSFTGGSHPDPPSFDVRRLVKHVWNAMNADVDDDASSLRVWGDGRTSGSNPKLEALVEELLPDGWATSRVDQRGYTAVQYCLTAPGGEWYFVRHSMVRKHHAVGTCRLDPDMESSS